MKRLTPKEYKETVEAMRLWPEHNKAQIRKLLDHIKAVELELEGLRKENAKLRQPTLGKEIKSNHVAPAPFIRAPIVTPPKVKQEGVGLATRLRYMFENSKTETDEWKRTLKWNSLTEEKAMKLIAEEQEKNPSKDSQ